MAKQQEPIRTEAFVHIGDRTVNIETLTPEQRSYVGAQLLSTMLNAGNEGKAVFAVEGLPERDLIFHASNPHAIADFKETACAEAQTESEAKLA